MQSGQNHKQSNKYYQGRLFFLFLKCPQCSARFSPCAWLLRMTPPMSSFSHEFCYVGSSHRRPPSFRVRENYLLGHIMGCYQTRHCKWITRSHIWRHGKQRARLAQERSTCQPTQNTPISLFRLPRRPQQRALIASPLDRWSEPEPRHLFWLTGKFGHSHIIAKKLFCAERNRRGFLKKRWDVGCGAIA